MNHSVSSMNTSLSGKVAAITGATENAVSRRVERKSQPTTSGAM